MIPAQVRPYYSYFAESSRFHRAAVFVLTARLEASRDEATELSKADKILTERVAPDYEDGGTYILSRLFISHIAAFEIFLQETMAVVIQQHPKKIGSIEFPLSEVLDASGPSELVQRATEQFLNGLMYAKPKEYLQKFCGLLAIDPEPIKADWGVFVEAKARRDLGVHNAWKCNSIYLRKVREAGFETTFEVGDSVIPHGLEYMNAVDDSLTTLALEITRQVCETYWPQFSPKRKEG